MSKVQLITTACALVFLIITLHASNNHISNSNQINVLQNNDFTSAINYALNINRNISINNSEYYAISGAVAGALNSALTNQDTGSVIQYAKNIGRVISQMFKSAQGNSDVAQKIKIIAQLVKNIIYQYFSVNLFNQQVDICNINTSDVDTSNINIHYRSDYIFGYELGVLEQYIKEILPVINSSDTSRAYMLVKTGMNNLVNTIQFQDNNTIFDENIAGNLHSIILGLNELLNNYYGCNQDDINKIKNQLARVCKAYINITILNDINNIN